MAKRDVLADLERGALGIEQAAAYLDVSVRWLKDPACPIPKADLRKPGALRPVWRWRRADLDAFLEGRLVQPGTPSPWGQ